MQLSAPDVAIAGAAACDFGLMPDHETTTVLRHARPRDWERCLTSASSRRLIEELGVVHRYLTHLPGCRPDPRRLTAFDLARSAFARLQARHATAVASLDALIFVSSSNPHPCNSQAAMLAAEFGIRPSCLDLKAGCSGGVLGLQQAALLIRAGCERVVVVMAENLSHLTPPDDLRMLLTVGDGAACVLLERRPGPGFLAMLHGTAPQHARAMAVVPPFPPASREVEYAYRVHAATTVAPFLRQRWRELFGEALAAAEMRRDQLDLWLFHQTHRGQVDDLLRDLAMPASRTVRLVERHGNMGTASVGVALAEAFDRIAPGTRLLLQAVGGGVSWAAILAEQS